MVESGEIVLVIIIQDSGIIILLVDWTSTIQPTANGIDPLSTEIDSKRKEIVDVEVKRSDTSNGSIITLWEASNHWAQ